MNQTKMPFYYGLLKYSPFMPTFSKPSDFKPHVSVAGHSAVLIS